MLRKRILAAATATILALGMSMGGASVAFASIPAPVSTSGNVTVYESPGLTCNDFPGTLGDNLDVSLGGYVAPSAEVGGSWGSLTWNDDVFSWNINDNWTVDLCIKGGNKVVWINDASGVGSYNFKALQGNGISHTNFADARYTVPQPKEASASIAFTDPTCEAAEGLNEAGFSTTGATLTSSNVVDSTYTVVFTANEGYKFPAGANVTNDGNTLTLTGELDPALTGEQCEEEPEPASASLLFLPPTCESPEAVGVSIVSGATETSRNVVGSTYTVVFTADTGFEFPAGEGVSGDGSTLTLTGELDPALTGEQCEEEPAVASASIAFTDPTCESAEALDVAGFSATGATVTTNTVVDGTYTVIFTADSGFEFPAGDGVSPDGSTLTFTGQLDPALTGEQCEEPTEASVEASLIATECDTDVPFILFSVALNDPDGVSTDDGNVYLVFSDGVNEERIKIAELDENGEAEGRILWPGAEITDGIASGWPGWELVDGQWTNVGDANFGWTRVLNSATIEINPELEVELNYPEATPDCVVDPQPIEPMIDVQPFDCFFGGSYELPFIEGVVWTVDGEVVDSGIYPVLEAGTEVTVEASLDPTAGLYFADGAESVWNLEFNEPELGCGELPTFPLVSPGVTSTQPTCDTANGSYTLSATEGVTWFVNGVERAAGTYQSAAGTSVSIEAVANEGFGFGFEQQTEWNVAFTAPADCELPELETLALTGVTGLAGMAGLVALLITLTGVGMVAARRRVEV